jgi:hypothetical protein
MDGTPRSPFVITYKLTAQQSDDEQATRLLDSLRKREPVGGPTEWIALSRVGTEGRRAIEVVVVAPDSCRAEAERLSAWLAQGIRETASSAP